MILDMAITMKDVVENPGILLRGMEEPKCARCGHVLAGEERKKTAEGILCDDCYYEALGGEIELHPIGPGPRRR